MEAVYIGLGSNLAEPVQQLDAALAALAQLPSTRLIATSAYYSSAPLGPSDQPRFTNAVAHLETNLTPHALLDQLQAIELSQGRQRNSERWGPRTLDLDILLFGKCIINDERLRVPHYHMHARPFVLVPLAELCPADFSLADGRLLADLLRQCPVDPTLQRLHTPQLCTT
ncbi:2-amino-4-hydroxy-6-hydroxymethyldihydropteridine diphosphokinase [Pseudomonas sp. C27(2019)]|uniref:2-amino-4-hydroxy-6- hydroxymethyldihydropteridine diphosphokinase n=1 Tax=Pseudomonas sp. C27(2019) TaxID=2604941 RepID=UPI0012443D91|nr:2-amino-4-hydroxy-6-hydroxymethyldihydropteridine diphosphokinase [Pseudomonas sp. C27(2019)]QEY59361.1 2-amino-4-hydroxy-6-hydroxymethyldihydropteridine diphosphokinase [Pseudomonas sp. C27(2019)]